MPAHTGTTQQWADYLAALEAQADAMAVALERGDGFSWVPVDAPARPPRDTATLARARAVQARMAGLLASGEQQRDEVLVRLRALSTHRSSRAGQAATSPFGSVGGRLDVSG